MNLTMEELALELLRLPTKSRAELAYRLMESLDEEEDADVDAAWAEEIQRRRAEVLEGKVECPTADEVMRDARRKLASDRQIPS